MSKKRRLRGQRTGDMQFFMEMVDRGEQLYCFDGHTLREVAAFDQGVVVGKQES